MPEGGCKPRKIQYRHVREKKTELTKPRLPLFQGILPLDRSRILADIVAGISLAAVGIPEAHVNAGLRTQLDRQGLSEVIGTNRLFDTLRDCLGAYHATNIGPD